MARLITITSGKGGVGKSLAYEEYVSLANGDVIQIGPYVDSLVQKYGIKQKLLVKAGGGTEVFEVIDVPTDLKIDIVDYDSGWLNSRKDAPVCIMRKPAPNKLMRISTNNGDINVTREHEFLVLRNGVIEKVKAADIIPHADYLLYYNYPLIDQRFKQVDLFKAKLLGYLIGDGHFEKRGKRVLLHVFSHQEKCLNNIKDTFLNVFGEFSLLKDKRGDKVWRVSYFKQKAIQDLIEEFGVLVQNAGQKEIPRRIFESDNLACASFISALFDCDAHVCKNRNSIEYDTKSEKLAYQVSNLLKIRFNIDNCVKPHFVGYRGLNKKYYRLVIAGEDASNYYLKIGFGNISKMERLRQNTYSKKNNTNIKLYPLGKIFRDVRIDSGKSGVDLASFLGCSRQSVYGYEWGVYALSKTSANKFLSFFEDINFSSKKLELVKDMISKGYSFRKVNFVKEVDYDFDYVYDFQVSEKGGHFVHATGIVISNTTTAINIGAALNYFGKDVIIVDANLTTPNVGLHLGAPIVPVSLNHVLLGKAEIADAIYEHESGTKIIPSSLSVRELRKINHSKLKEVSKKLRKVADYIIYDSAAGLGEEAIAAMEAADEMIIVTNPEITAVTDALKTSKVAEELGKEVRGIIVTRVKGDKYEMPISNIREMLELPILGVIPEDKNMRLAIFKKNALVYTHPKSKAARAYKEIAAKICGNNSYKEDSFMDKLFG